MLKTKTKTKEDDKDENARKKLIKIGTQSHQAETCEHIRTSKGIIARQQNEKTRRN